MDPLKNAKKLSKLIEYMIGRHPDEFGLLPDEDGFVKLKTLLKAVNEEPGWRHVRQASLDEARISLKAVSFEIVDKTIRARDRSNLKAPDPDIKVPKLLYTCVRRRAHRHTVEKGITPSGEPNILLSDDQALAMRIGRRSDSSPVLITVNTETAVQMGCAFSSAGKALFIADDIPTGCFTAPPLPKEKEKPASKTEDVEMNHPKTPGSYTINLTEDPDVKKRTRRERQKKQIAWKKERRHQRGKKW
ncbi:MAG: hypothetical protein HKM93_01770 [Desulfobacteraceae bacterium]|nr:hypothetical protein [Desulfobacteraceae bacterium]